MKSFIQYLNEITPHIAARLAGARASQGKGYKRQSKKAMKGAEKRAVAQGIEPKKWEQEKAKAYDLGQKSGRVTSKNLRNPSWPDMKDRPDRILTHKFGTTY